MSVADNPHHRPPDYQVSAWNHATDLKGRIGVAWLNASGRISLHLDPFVVIQGSQDLQITLFPNEEREDAP
jgi:hypothetical protein